MEQLLQKCRENNVRFLFEPDDNGNARVQFKKSIGGGTTYTSSYIVESVVLDNGRVSIENVLEGHLEQFLMSAKRYAVEPFGMWSNGRFLKNPIIFTDEALKGPIMPV